MEVRVTDFDGLDDSSVISVRAGSTRRQAPLSSLRNRSLRFPMPLEAGAALKVDLLQQVTSKRLVLHDHEESYCIPFQGQGGELRSFSLHVSADGGSTLDGATGECEEDSVACSADVACFGRRQDAASSAREYLETHALLPYLQGLLEAVVQDKPADPYQYLCDQLCFAHRAPNATASSSTARKLLGGIEEMRKVPGTPDASTRATCTPSSPSPCQDDCGLLADYRSPSMGDLQQDPACARLHRQWSAPASIPTDNGSFDAGMRSLKDDLQEALDATAESGEMLALLGAVEEADREHLLEMARADEEAALHTYCQRVSLRAVVAKSLQQETEFDTMRERLKNMLMSAYEEGSLEKALTKDLQHDIDLDDCCSRLRALFNGACEDGSLHAALSSLAESQKAAVADSSFDSLCERLKQCECSACEDGSLDAALSSMAGAEVLETGDSKFEALRERLKVCLCSAYEEGSLEKALIKDLQHDIDLDDCCSRLRALFNGACEDGSLTAALSSLAESQNSVVADSSFDSLRERLKQCLCGACEDGSLDAALSSMARADDVETGGSNFEALRERLKVCLCSAYEEGSLEEALTKDLQHDIDLDECCSRVRALLDGACENGSLQAALSTLPRSPNAEAADSSFDTLRGRLKQCLCSACENGSLDAALSALSARAQNAQTAHSNFDVLRERLKTLLCSACEDGNLDAALSTLAKAESIERVCRSKDEYSSAPGAEKFQEALEALPRVKVFASFREQMREEIACAFLDGSLLAALEACPQEAEEAVTPPPAGEKMGSLRVNPGSNLSTPSELKETPRDEKSLSEQTELSRPLASLPVDGISKTEEHGTPTVVESSPRPADAPCPPETSTIPEEYGIPMEVESSPRQPDAPCSPETPAILQEHGATVVAESSSQQADAPCPLETATIPQEQGTPLVAESASRPADAPCPPETPTIPEEQGTPLVAESSPRPTDAPCPPETATIPEASVQEQGTPMVAESSQRPADAPCPPETATIPEEQGTPMVTESSPRPTDAPCPPEIATIPEAPKTESLPQKIACPQSLPPTCTRLQEMQQRLQDLRSKHRALHGKVERLSSDMSQVRSAAHESRRVLAHLS
eukprot:TRINITY_DN5650_c0_g1_i3.p1 TRINITY_DN5650_c0_g1~~TRINITY_DN5650_c0_g1_i3.p1  ORF type:complete len:1104 (-),score=259.65 TRINITY_DN5650_c0_g1_i3:13-3324(-)